MVFDSDAEESVTVETLTSLELKGHCCRVKRDERNKTYIVKSITVSPMVSSSRCLFGTIERVNICQFSMRFCQYVILSKLILYLLETFSFVAMQ